MMMPRRLLLEFWRILTLLFVRFISTHARQSNKRKPLKLANPTPAPYRNKRKPAWVVHKVIRLKAFHPQASCRSIEQTFNRLYSVNYGMTVSSSYVHYTIQDHYYEILELRRRFKHRIPRPMTINEVWAIDMTGKGDVFGAVHPILGIVEHGSRKLLSLEALDNKNAWTLLGHLFIAIGRYGKPRQLRSDNDAVFKSRIFRSLLAIAGVKQQFSDPGCPWMNGRVERLFGTLKEKLNRFKIDGRETLSGMLIEFSFWYNAVRPHQHLRGCTPNEIWFRINPYSHAPKSAQYFSAWDGELQGFYLRH